MAKRPKITPTQLDMYTEPIVDIYQALEEHIFLLVANRLKTSKDITADGVLQWQLDKLNQLRLINSETVDALSEVTGVARVEIEKAINTIGVKTIESVDYELSSAQSTIAVKSEIDRILESYVNQTFLELDNYVNQTLITTAMGVGAVPAMYRKIIEETTAKVLSGTMTVNQAITETVIEWSQSGVSSGFVDKGGRRWSTSSYARMVIRSTANSTYNEARMERMKEHNVDLVLVSSLPDPRVICSEIQGKVASILPIEENKSQYPSVYQFGYGTAKGLRGKHTCRV